MSSQLNSSLHLRQVRYSRVTTRNVLSARQLCPTLAVENVYEDVSRRLILSPRFLAVTVFEQSQKHLHFGDP